MLADGLSLASLIQQAPALAVAMVALVLAVWAVRSARRADIALEARLGGSAVRQGERLGRHDQAIALLDMRRLITEEELAEYGVRLSYWPPDGRRSSGERRSPDAEPEDFPPDEDPRTDYVPAARPVPPLPPEVAARHRRSNPA